ncbi:hypothetical protein Taro_049237 [Colocasia esculenta]|uniref:Uncharacterized protein n=1 Tax=Colocasia esculenta TaxID=4460 RepID=A0A843XAE7_COLES|nr:hypothetical protein [Colocasia esculenta]
MTMKKRVERKNTSEREPSPRISSANMAGRTRGERRGTVAREREAGHGSRWGGPGEGAWEAEVAWRGRVYGVGVTRLGRRCSRGRLAVRAWKGGARGERLSQQRTRRQRQQPTTCDGVGISALIPI